MKRIAIIIPGGISLRDSEYTIPHLFQLIEGLSAEQRINVYSLTRMPAPENVPFTFKCINAGPFTHPLIKIIKMLLLLLKEHAKNRFEILHGFWAFPAGFIAVLLAKIFGLKSIVTIAGGEAADVVEINYGNLRKQPLKFITLYTCNHCDQAVFLTRFQLNLLQKYKFKNQNYAVIPIGAHESFFNTRIDQLQKPLRIIHIANLNPVKDQISLLKTFQLILLRGIKAELRIIGPDFLNGQMQKKAQELNITAHVQFLGWQPQSVIIENLKWAQIMLHTSFYEGQGVVLAQAAASGVVLAGSRVGLLSDLENSAALCADVHNAKSLSDLVLKLAGDDGLFQTLRQNALTWAKENSMKNTIEQYNSIYESF